MKPHFLIRFTDIQLLSKLAMKFITNTVSLLTSSWTSNSSQTGTITNHTLRNTVLECTYMLLVQSPCAWRSKRPKFKTSYFGIRKGLFIKKVPTAKMGALVMPWIHLKKSTKFRLLLHQGKEQEVIEDHWPVGPAGVRGRGAYSVDPGCCECGLEGSANLWWTIHTSFISSGEALQGPFFVTRKLQTEFL